MELNSSGSFVRAFGWGVAPAAERKDEFQDCTSYCEAGIAGFGDGQLTGPQGVAIGPDGTVWVSEYAGGSGGSVGGLVGAAPLKPSPPPAHSRIQEFSESGAYLHSFGSQGTGDGQFDDPAGITFLGGDLYVADNGNAFYATDVGTATTPTWKPWVGPGEGPSKAVACPTTSLCLMAAGKSAYGGAPLYYATALGGGWSVATTPTYGLDSISCPGASFCVTGAIDAVMNWSQAPASTSWSGTHQQPYIVGNNMNAVSCLSSSFCAIASAEGYVYVATSLAQIESESWTRSDVDGSTALNGIACISRSACVTVDGNGNVFDLAIDEQGDASVSEQNVDGANSLNAIACSGTVCATVDGKGDVLTSTDAGQNWNAQYALGGDLTAVSCASASLCATVSEQGEASAFNPAGVASEASQRPSQPGTTIEYDIPVSGQGAPQDMSGEQLEKWGQTDDPEQATAIFPPDEPQGWPASGYVKATIDYMDEHGRTVNAASPGGGIATTEYNEANEVKRTLSPDNRARAMAKGCVSLAKKECVSAEAAAKLDTETDYSPDYSQIVKTLGPEHEVKLANGEEVQARAVTHDYYDEGAEKAEVENEEEYNLLTKNVTAALLTNGDEKEKRTTSPSYNGQKDLGWILRQPTSTTVDPEGLKLTTTTIYNPSTGNVLETRSSGAGVAEEAKPSGYVSEWGKADAAPRLSGPDGVAADANGDVWVADTGQSRLLQLNGSGEFMAQYGSDGTADGQFKEPEAIAVDSAGDVWVADTGNDRIEELSSDGAFKRVVGSEGAGTGQFKSPAGIAVDSEGHVWVADTGNDRLQELSSTGEFIRAIGAQGKEDGQLESPAGIAIGEAGDILVADTGNNRVQELSPTGSYLSQFEVPAPIGLAIDDGKLWVTADLGGKVQEFSMAGAELRSLGSSGEGDGQFKAAWGLLQQHRVRHAD